MTTDAAAPTPIKRLLVANRSRNRHPRVPRGGGTRHPTVAIYAEEDKLSLHRFKADEAYLIGRARRMGSAARGLSLDRRGHPRRARRRRSTPSIPATAFCRKARNSPRPAPRPASSSSARRPQTMRTLGNKVAARNLAVVGRRAGDAGDRRRCPTTPRRSSASPREVGYPVMLKASWGGGGRGMRPIESEDRLLEAVLRGQARGQGRVRQGRSLSRKAGAPRAPCRGADPRRRARQSGASVRARLLDPAPQPEGDRARAGALSRRRDARSASAKRR